jgi:hypothetical protein
VEGIPEPVDPTLAAALRRAVVEHVRIERRRTFPALVHVGVPGGTEEVFAVVPEEPLDHALRADVVAALLQRSRRGSAVPLVWLTRPGALELQDVDADWLSAARSAASEARVVLTLVVVTRSGWMDPRSGAQRVWKRLRVR